MIRSCVRHCLLSGLFLAAPLPAPAAEPTLVATREELVAALAAAKPGAEIRVAPGIYRGGISQAYLRGTAEQPIVVAAADPDQPPVIDGGGSGLQLSSPQHVELRDLEFANATGNGLNIDDTSAAAGPRASHVVLRGVVVRDVGPRGNCDGIKLSGVEEFQIMDCRVERWGDGGSGVDMVGCHNGAIDGCQFLGPGGEQANGVQTKGGTSDVVVRRCRFENAGGRGVNIGGSTGLEFFRPLDATYEARNITVEDCEFLGGVAAVAFVGVDGAVVRHNTIYAPQKWAVRILQESTAPRFVPCRDGRFEDNVIAFRSAGVYQLVNMGGSTSPESFAFSGNRWSCLDRPDDTRRFVNLPVEEEGGAYGPPPPFEDPENGDLRIRNSQDADPGARRGDER